jgi:hypothetical protein
VALAVGAVFALVIPLLVVGSLGDGDRGPAPAPTGVTDQATFYTVRAGQSEAQVRARLGSAPREIVPVLRPGGPADCWVYGRRSGARGEYRFCFRDGFLAAKVRA